MCLQVELLEEVVEEKEEEEDVVVVVMVVVKTPWQVHLVVLQAIVAPPPQKQ